MNKWQLYQVNENIGKIFKESIGGELVGRWPVFGERVDLELRRGLMAPVHPLGGHLRFPQHDEESYAIRTVAN
jgi:hypothetical protein